MAGKASIFLRFLMDKFYRYQHTVSYQRPSSKTRTLLTTKLTTNYSIYDLTKNPYYIYDRCGCTVALKIMSKRLLSMVLSITLRKVASKKTHTSLKIKMAKIQLLLKRLKNHTLRGYTHLYNPYKGAHFALIPGRYRSGRTLKSWLPPVCLYLCQIERAYACLAQKFHILGVDRKNCSVKARGYMPSST